MSFGLLSRGMMSSLQIIAKRSRSWQRYLHSVLSSIRFQFVPTSGRGPLILLAPPESLHSPLLLSSTREPTTPSVRSTGALSLWIAVARNVTCCGAHYSTVTLQKDADCSSLRYWTLRYALYDGWIMPSPGILSGWALPMHAKHEVSG